MTAYTFVLLLTAQVYPAGYAGGPADPWGKCRSLTSLKARQTTDQADPTKDKTTRDIEASIITIDEKEVTVSYTLGTSPAYSTYLRSAAGWFRVSKDWILDQKTTEKQEVVVDGKKLICTLSEVQFKPGAESKVASTLKTWTSPSVRGGMVKFELVRRVSENSVYATYTGEVTKLEDSLTIDGKKVECAVFATKEVNNYGRETSWQAWHSDAVPGKVVRILSETKIKDRPYKLEWVLTEFHEPPIDLKLKKKD